MKRNFGFTIIELMIVVAIVAILVALAIPSFNQWIRKANRGEAQALLMNWANNQEVWRSSNTGYTTADVNVPHPSHDRYEFSVSAGTNTYTLTATPNTVGGQDQDKERGTPCDSLTLDQNGTKSPPICWQE